MKDHKGSIKGSLGGVLVKVQGFGAKGMSLNPGPPPPFFVNGCIRLRYPVAGLGFRD